MHLLDGISLFIRPSSQRVITQLPITYFRIFTTAERKLFWSGSPRFRAHTVQASFPPKMLETHQSPGTSHLNGQKVTTRHYRESQVIYMKDEILSSARNDTSASIQLLGHAEQMPQCSVRASNWDLESASTITETSQITSRNEPGLALIEVSAHSIQRE